MLSPLQAANIQDDLTKTYIACKLTQLEKEFDNEIVKIDFRSSFSHVLKFSVGPAGEHQQQRLAITFVGRLRECGWKIDTWNIDTRGWLNIVIAKL